MSKPRFNSTSFSLSSNLKSNVSCHVILMLLLRHQTITFLVGPLPVWKVRFACDFDSKISSGSLSLWDALKRSGVWRKKLSCLLQKTGRWTMNKWRYTTSIEGLKNYTLDQWFSNFINQQNHLDGLLKPPVFQIQKVAGWAPQNAFLS